MYKRLILISLFVLSPALYARGGKVTWRPIQWKVIHSEHFDIHYPQGYDILGNTALIYAEEANILIGKKLHHTLSAVVPVYIYPSHIEFQSTNIIYSQIGEGVGGFTEPVKRRVAIPFLGSYDKFRHVITHELVHAFQYDILLASTYSGAFGGSAISKAPLWLIEGMAEYVSLGWDSTAEMVLRDALLSGWTPSLIDMTYGRVMSQFIFYKGGQAANLFIAETFGENKLGELLRDIRDQKSFDDAVKTNLGISFEELDRRWLIWVKRKFYPFINKKAPSEEADVVTRHFEDKSYLNLHPAISPDGQFIAYITIRNLDEVIILRSAEVKNNTPDYSVQAEFEYDEKPAEKVLVRAGNNADVYQLNLLDNRISFTADSKNIFFAANSQGQDRLYLFDIKKRKIIGKWSPGLDRIQYPSLSKDSRQAVFSGTIKGKTNLYVIDLTNSSLRQLTDDYFSQQEPSFSFDAKTIVYSSNENDRGYIESSDYNIWEFDLKTGEKKNLISLNGGQDNPKYIDEKNENILFISSHTGVPNVYLWNRNGEVHNLTDTQSGITNAEIDGEGNKIVFSVYRNQGYDIGIRKEELRKKIKENSFSDSTEQIMSFPVTPYPIYNNPNVTAVSENYKPKFSPDVIFFGLQWSSYFGFGGFIYSVLTDYLGDHRLEIYADYFNPDADPNFKIDYTFLKNRINLHAGVFQSTNYFSVLNYLDLATINDFLYNPYFYTKSIRHYGGYMSAVYPISPFLSLRAGTEVARYEETFYQSVPDPYKRKDIQTNIFSLQTAIVYNNVLYSYMGPLKGWHFAFSVEQTLNLTGSDFVFNRMQVDLRRYFLFGERYVFTMRVMGGVISGSEKDFFPWLIGGYNTVRGYPFISMQGDNFFVANFELRFPFLDYLVFGFPSQWAIRGFSGVLFLDMGSAYDTGENWTLLNSKTGALEDLRMSVGWGIRILLFPGVFIKIDWATPWDLKSIDPINKWEGRFSLGYEF